MAKKSHGVVNIISIVSVCGVAVATAAIVIVLSVFNGFTQLASTHLSAIDPDLKLVPVEGKAFGNGDSIASAIAALPGVARVTPVVEERGLLVIGNRQMPVIFKGTDTDSVTVAIGVAANMALVPGEAVTATLYAPKRVGRINPANPAASFHEAPVLITDYFEVAQPEYDNEYVMVPLDVARELLEYEHEATAIEVNLMPGAKAPVADNSTWRALDRYQQQEDAFKMIQIEKWVTFLMLGFILVIACFNIISTLSLMVIEKRDNMATLIKMGATASMARGVFAWMGMLITAIGGIAGVALGSALTLAQQWGGFVKLQGDPSQLTIDVYPVQLAPADIAIVLLLILAIGVVIGLSQYLIKKLQ